MRTSIAVAIVLLGSAPARAEGDAKSPTLATVASVAGTVGSLALAVRSGEEMGLFVAGAGLLVGPSLGHWYAGDAGLRGLAIRGAGLGVIALTIAPAFDCLIDERHDRTCKAASTGFAIGFGTLLGGALYDFVTASDSAHRANRKAIVLAPTVVAGPRGHGTGLGLTARF